jgi:ribosomal protein S18 acetylase RimI-like enzyme
MSPDLVHPFEIRPAQAADVDAIADAHRDSIDSIGPLFYPADVVTAWGARIEARMYLDAIVAGEQFFVAVEHRDGLATVLGFSSHHVSGGVHGVGVYVRGRAARRGIGSALLELAEASAIAAGATSLQLDSSLAAVDFYRSHGFEETGRGAHRLRSGDSMDCVFMRKYLEQVSVDRTGLGVE